MRISPPLGLALPGQHLDQLALAVAGDAGDADDLAGAHREREVAHRRLAAIVERCEMADVEPRLAEIVDARRGRRQLLGADHAARHVVRGEIGDLAVGREAAAAQDGHLVGKGHHLAEFVGDHQHRDLAAIGQPAQQAQHLVGLLRRQHRGRLVEDQQAALEIELLQDLAFLPLAGRERRHLDVERHAERHAREERLERLALLAPVDHGRQLGARQHQVLRHRHRRHQGEMLVDHAEAERVGGARDCRSRARGRRR